MTNSQGLTLAVAIIIASAITPLIVVAQISDQQYAVLSRVLEHGLGDECRELVIEDQTTSGAFALNTPESPLEAAAELVGVEPSTLVQWQTANQDFEYLSEKFSLDCKYHLITTKQREALFATAAGDEPERGWRNFRQQYTDAAGIIRMAIPVFDQTEQHALAYIEFDCGPSCGSGRFVVLQKNQQGDWTVAGGSLVWMAAE